MTKTIKQVLASGAVILKGENRAVKADKGAKPVNYTPEQTAQMVADYQAGVTVETLANTLGKTVRSVVAKLSREGVYQKKEYKTKTGDAVVKKDAHADAIGAILQLPENDIESLTKANKSALRAIFEALANSKPV
jgi:hypothetical protein